MRVRPTKSGLRRKPRPDLIERNRQRVWPKRPEGHKEFMQHLANARRRGIPFLLSFEEWWMIWQESGHWLARGKQVGQYAMARPGDVGPYIVGNVGIITIGDNTRESNARRWGSR